MILLRSSYFMFRRMLRNYVGFAILLLTPIALITLLGFLADDAVNEQLGIFVKAEVAFTIIFAFQLFGGFYTMEYIKEDLLSSSRWRMYSLPIEIQRHAVSILLTSTIFNILQGYVIILYTQLMYSINWGNHFFILITLAAVALFSQLLFMNLVLGVKEYKTADRLGTTYGIAVLVVAGVWFPLPDYPVFNFLATYGNPLSLGENMAYANMAGENLDKGFISIGILLVSSVILFITSSYLGRRRLL